MLPCCSDLLFLITCRILDESFVPASYQIANISLIAKDPSNLKEVKLFRPIACSNVESKILWAIVNAKLTAFLTKNKYIKLRIQKGFVPRIPGCIEHSATLYEALRDARGNKKKIICVWLDLANAFGSVRHNLILFALRWYHVPTWVIRLIFLYYDSLFAKVVTPNWATSFFPFEIGVFQGCTISPILFDLVYQLCIDFVDQYRIYPYVFSQSFDSKRKFGLIELSQLVYADDHTLINRTLRGAQSNLDSVYKWLCWTKCMEAKPSKCKSLSFCQPDSSTGSSYGAVIGNLRIGNHLIADIGDNPFKFLGRLILKSLSDIALRDSVLQIFKEHMSLVDSQFLKGAAKTWIYNNYILAFLSWPLLVYDFAPYFADQLTAITNRFLKKWLKVFHPASPEIFYLPEAGLNCKHPKTFLKCMQLTKHHLLSTSRDPTVRFIHESKLLKAISSRGRKWSPETTLLEIEYDLTWESKFLPRGNLSSSHPSTISFLDAPIRTKRKQISKRMKKIEADKMRCRLLDLCKNGNFTTWDKLMPSDITWLDMIYDLSEAVLSFRLNGISNSLPSPSNLRRWGVKVEGRCFLCSKNGATAAHILSNCYIALTQNRYTWRHDNVLICIHKDLVGLVSKINRRNASRIIPPLRQQRFQKKGDRKLKCQIEFRSILGAKNASDWQINFDFFNNPTIPGLTHVDTLSRPDIVIFSVSTKTLLWFEETVPLERNIIDAATRKAARYAKLKSEIMLKGWTVRDFTFEVGALGFISKSFNYMLNVLDF